MVRLTRVDYLIDAVQPRNRRTFLAIKGTDSFAWLDKANEPVFESEALSETRSQLIGFSRAAFSLHLGLYDPACIFDGERVNLVEIQLL